MIFFEKRYILGYRGENPGCQWDMGILRRADRVWIVIIIGHLI
ncbi:MAG: hypothetical protein ACI9P5_000359 [Saprospiraceae bacterium]|jgi:hypothetical protein